jgi:hypothetical protein
MQTPFQHETKMQGLLKFCVLLIGPFFLGCALALLGIAAYVWLAQPKRLAAEVLPNETNAAAILAPQPTHVSVTQTNVYIVVPPIAAYLNGTATNARVWAHGKAFESGMPAAWALFCRAWPLWGLSAAAVIYWFMRRRSGRSMAGDLRTEKLHPGVDDYVEEKSDIYPN